MIQFHSIKEYPQRNKISPYIKICGPSVICYDFFFFFFFFFFLGGGGGGGDLTAFGAKLDLTPFGINILQSDVTLPSKMIIVFW